MKKEERVKKQHFVPRGYLKNFCLNEDGRIWSFDRSIQKSIGTNIQDVAQEKFFYDLPKDVIKDSVDTQFVEKGLSMIEEQFAIDLKKLIKNTNATISLSNGNNPIILNENVKDAFAHQFGLLKLRTKEFRIMAQQINQKLLGFIANQYLDQDLRSGKAPKELEGQEIIVTTKPGYEAYEHILMAFHPDILDSFANLFFNKIWIIGFNDTSTPFFSSDNPISLHAHKTLKGHGTGIGSPWVELCIPISSKIMLIMLDRASFIKTHGSFENRIIRLSEENVEFYNSVIFRDCTRQIFCERDSFDLPRKMLKDSPEMANIDRKRIG